ncbi:MAG: hypothetical protein R3E96_10350 [Planctomycetota bacterium]
MREEKEIKVGGNVGTFRLWRSGGNYIETYSFLTPSEDIHIAYIMTRGVENSKAGKKWASVFTKSGRSFEREERMGAVDLESMTYDELLKYHKEADKQFTDWRVLGTPGEQFIIKTSSKRGAFIKNVITRLEASRKLFEQDFPPDTFGMKMPAISVVRVCGTEEVFHRYGDTPRGVGGWFNPKSEELVLYCGEKDKEEDAATNAVMSHEAFHQYCHFLFKQSEAHRWFDEGHGDYYAVANWFQGKAYVGTEAPGGYNRLPIIKSLIEDGRTVALADHLNFTHGEWQYRGVESYSQSWSIIYMLRQGALGKVPSEYWKDEYADIIPNYMNALLKGYADEYERIKKERSKGKDGEEVSAVQTLTREDLDMEARNRVWKKAMDASWGKIDLDEFERRWLAYVPTL